MKIIINLEKLQLFSFFYSKNFTNKVIKKFDWDDFWKRLNTTFKHIINFLKYNKSLNENIGLRCHPIYEKWHSFEDIIKECHSNIYDCILQESEKYLSNNKKILWQIHIGRENGKEVIHFLYFEDNEKRIIYPLILDLNHCIWKVNEEKPYRYKYSKNWKDWDFRTQENEIKKIIMNGIKQ